jgi:hypothetical protein
MTPGTRLRPIGTRLRIALAVSALGYTAWQVWLSNRQAQAVWAAGTDTVGQESARGEDG